jgi:hypothetical protein
MAIDFIPNTDKIMGAYQGTEATALASLRIDFDFGHVSRSSSSFTVKNITKFWAKVKGTGHGFGGGLQIPGGRCFPDWLLYRDSMVNRDFEGMSPGT